MGWLPRTLEDVEHMLKLYDVLQKYKCGDNRPAVLQPNYVMGAPHYDAIEKSGRKQYKDISIVEGRPSRWQRDGFVEAAREGTHEEVRDLRSESIISHDIRNGELVFQADDGDYVAKVK